MNPSTPSTHVGQVAVPAHKLVSKLQVMEKLGISDRTLEILVRKGAFPPPLRLGKTVRWAETVVEAWLHAKLHDQLNWTPRRRAAR